MTKGDNILLYIKIGAIWTKVGAVTGNSLSEVVSMVDSTVNEEVGSTDSGWIGSLPNLRSYTLNFSGVMYYSSEPNKVTYEQIKLLKRARTKIEWRLEATGVESERTQGFGYISNISQSSSIDDFTYYDCSIVGFGAIVTYPKLIEAYIITEYAVYMFFDRAVTMTNLGFSLSGTTSNVFNAVTNVSDNIWYGSTTFIIDNKETVVLTYTASTGDIADEDSNAAFDWVATATNNL